MTPAIQVENLVKTYRTGLLKTKKVEAVKGVSLEIGRGEVFGLLGPNGAGKTTILKILLGLAKPTSGQCHILGVRSTTHLARKKIGFLPEKHQFPKYLTGRQMLSIFGRMSGVEPAEASKRIPPLLELVSMSDAADRPIGGYSKGMMQRVGIAQALMNDPAIVFLDEPTDGVDPIGRLEIRKILSALRDQGKTVFLNSHLLSEVEQICSRVVILNKGVVAAAGTVDQLTRISQSYTIRSSAIPPALLESFEDAIVERIPADEGNLEETRLRVDSREGMNAFLDSLRAHGVSIEEITRTRTTLEDSFISAIGEHAGGGK